MKKVDNICYWIILFFTGSILGWFWEMAAFKCAHSTVPWTQIVLNLRGFLRGPWVPIYGFGFVLLVLLGRNFKGSPMKLFVGNILVCGLMEYITSYVLEVLFHARWWDYSEKFLNLHGRIYVGGLLFFGLAGLVAVYFIEPWMCTRIKQMNPYMKAVAVFLLAIAFCIDTFAALQSPNLGIGVSVMGVQ